MNTIIDPEKRIGDVVNWMDTGRRWLTETGPKIIMTALVTGVGLLVLKLVLILFKKFLNRFNLDPSLRSFLASALKIVYMIMLVISALSILGIPTTSIIAVFSAAAIAIGLAMKDSLGNVAGGILLLFSKPFRTGDTVEVKGLSGTVTKIDIIYTTFNTFDNKQFIIPNGQLIKETIINYSREEKRRLDLTFPVGYKTDIAKVKGILTKLVSENAKVLKHPEPIIGVSKYSENSMLIAVYMWCSTNDYLELMFEMNEKVKSVFGEEGIEPPSFRFGVIGQ